ncbi:MAG: hypothetical protein ACLR0O_00140 [Staphylococcus aureus]
MEKKTKILSMVIQTALLLAFIGFFFSLFIGNEKNISTYTNLILIFACSNYFFLARQKLEDACLNIFVRINGVLLVLWIVIAVIHLFV